MGRSQLGELLVVQSIVLIHSHSVVPSLQVGGPPGGLTYCSVGAQGETGVLQPASDSNKSTPLMVIPLVIGMSDSCDDGGSGAAYDEQRASSARKHTRVDVVLRGAT